MSENCGYIAAGEQQRAFFWLGNIRRLVVRLGRLITVYRAFNHMVGLIITLRQFEVSSKDRSVYNIESAYFRASLQVSYKKLMRFQHS